MIRLEDVGIDRNKKIISLSNRDVVFSFSNESIKSVGKKILETGHRRIPIVNRRKELVGIVTITDLLDAFLRKEDVKEKISDIMVRDVIYCNFDDTIDIVLKKLKFSRRGGFPVVDKKKKVVGLISERDFVWFFDKVRFNKKIKEVMTPKPFFVQNSISIFDCLKIMVNTKYRRLPVLSGDELVGIVTSVDMLRYIIENDFSFDALDEDLAFVYKTNVYTIEKDLDVVEAIKLMKVKDIGGIIVVDKKRLEGIITERDVLEEIE